MFFSFLIPALFLSFLQVQPLLEMNLFQKLFPLVAYTTCVWSVLEGKYESIIATARFWRWVHTSTCSNHLEVSSVWKSLCNKSCTSNNSILMFSWNIIISKYLLTLFVPGLHLLIKRNKHTGCCHGNGDIMQIITKNLTYWFPLFTFPLSLKPCKYHIILELSSRRTFLRN